MAYYPGFFALVEAIEEARQEPLPPLRERLRQAIVFLALVAGMVIGGNALDDSPMWPGILGGVSTFVFGLAIGNLLCLLPEVVAAWRKRIYAGIILLGASALLGGIGLLVALRGPA
ncbi:MAG TPA: hypothetical protein VHJ82_02200 [Actinomycetota bacterium]|nr:hypothetical protein [Actinomycetota bacterium]